MCTSVRSHDLAIRLAQQIVAKGEGLFDGAWLPEDAWIVAVRAARSQCVTFDNLVEPRLATSWRAESRETNTLTSARITGAAWPSLGRVHVVHFLQRGALSSNSIPGIRPPVADLTRGRTRSARPVGERSLRTFRK